MFLFLSLAQAADYAAYRAALAEEAGWEVVSNNNAEVIGPVQVRHKVIQGQDCLEGSGSAPYSADLLLKLATDVVNQPSWSTWAVKASVKLTSGATDFDYYQLLDNPFPIHDRYWFVHATVLRQGEDRKFLWQAVDPVSLYPDAVKSLLASYPDAVMTAINVGDWTFTPQANNTTRIRYRICTDVGGNIPSWAGEYAARTTLPTNLADLVKQAKKVSGG